MISDIQQYPGKGTCCWLDDWYFWLLAHWCSLMIVSTITYSALVIGTYCGVALGANHFRYLLMAYTNLGTITVRRLRFFLKNMFCPFASSAGPRRRTLISHFRSDDPRKSSATKEVLAMPCWITAAEPSKICDDSWARIGNIACW